MNINTCLAVVAVINATVATLHVACIYYDETWYRFMGGEVHRFKLTQSRRWGVSV